MTKLIIFDLDGTLLDTLDDLTNSVNYGLRALNYPTHDRTSIRNFVGNGITKLLERSLPADAPEDALEKLSALFHPYYALHRSDTTHPYSGISEVTEQLKEKGYLLAVASNKRDDAVKALITHCFPNHFDIVYGESDGVPRKPAPDIIYKILEEAAVKPSECLYIGDSEPDIETVQNAGISGLFVSWGFRTRETLAAHGGEPIIDHPEEIFQYLQT